MEFQQEWRNLSTNSTAIFTENRPYEAVHYYILVVSNGRVSFDVHIHMNHCGDSGYRISFFKVANFIFLWPF